MGFNRVTVKCSSTDCKIKYSGSSDRSFVLDKDTDNYVIKYSGSGDLDIIGDARSLVVYHSGSGELDLKGVKSDTANVFFSGSGPLHLSVVSKVEGRNSSSSNLYLYEDGKNLMKGTGSGDVIFVNK